MSNDNRNEIDRSHVEHNTVDNVEAHDDRNRYIDNMIELERLRGEVDALAPYKKKYIQSVKADLLKQFKNVNDDMLAVIDEKLNGEDEDQLRKQAELLTIELRVNNKKYFDPTPMKHGRRPSLATPVQAQYEQGRETISKARGWRNEKQISQIRAEGGKRNKSTNKPWWRIW